MAEGLGGWNLGRDQRNLSFIRCFFSSIVFRVLCFVRSFFWCAGFVLFLFLWSCQCFVPLTCKALGTYASLGVGQLRSQARQLDLEVFGRTRYSLRESLQFVHIYIDWLRFSLASVWRMWCLVYFFGLFLVFSWTNQTPLSSNALPSLFVPGLPPGPSGELTPPGAVFLCEAASRLKTFLYMALAVFRRPLSSHFLCFWGCSICGLAFLFSGWWAIFFLFLDDLLL